MTTNATPTSVNTEELNKAAELVKACGEAGVYPAVTVPRTSQSWFSRNLSYIASGACVLLGIGATLGAQSLMNRDKGSGSM